MVAFFPIFDVGTEKDALSDNQIIIDCSNSMKHEENLLNSIAIAKIILKQLKASDYFNIVTYGAGNIPVLKLCVHSRTRV